MGKLPESTLYYSFMRKYARLQIQQHRKTNATGVYQVKGYLFIQFPYWYDGDVSGANKAAGAVRFWLEGLWSDKSRQLLMLGSASWVVEGKPLILDAVLDLNYTANNNPILYNAYISGTLKSLVCANDPGYFDPFSIFSFPSLPNYNYSLLSHGSTSSSDSDLARLSYEGSKYCWVIMGESIELELEYAAECREEHHHHCSPLGSGSLPRLLLFTPIQCSAAERKMRYMATFQNTKYDQAFGLNSTVIGEASWDDDKKELFGIACRLLDPLNRSATEVGDCTMRLSLRYTTAFTVRIDPKFVGRFRSTRHVDKSGYFRKIHLTKPDRHGLLPLPSVTYEYTEVAKVRRWCAVDKPVKRGRGRNTYPDVHSDNMRFDLSVQNSKGQTFAWVYASPLWAGNDAYKKKIMMISEAYNTNTSHSNVSYRLSLSSSSELKFGSVFASLNWSANGDNEVEIKAEGVYNAETGYLCMVGCRKLDISSDCEILVTLELAPLTGTRGGRTKGTITSTRAKTDPLHFLRHDNVLRCLLCRGGCIHDMENGRGDRDGLDI